MKPGSVGKVLPGVEVALLDDEFKPVPNGDLGQFAISTKDPGLFLGYLGFDVLPYRRPARNNWLGTTSQHTVLVNGVPCRIYCRRHSHGTTGRGKYVQFYVGRRTKEVVSWPKGYNP